MPTVRLATKNVETLPAADGARTDYFDNLCTGLFLRVTPNGVRSWGVMFRVDGKLRRMTFGRATSAGASTGTLPHLGLAEARQKAKDALERVQRGEDPSRSDTASRGSVEAAIERWLEKVQGKRTAHEGARIMRTYVLPIWTGRQLASITPADVYNLVDDVATKRGKVMGNRVLGRLKSFFKWQAGTGQLSVNPAQHTPKPAPEAERKIKRVLDAGEMVKLWNGCEAVGFPFGPAVQLLLLTGARRSEIFELEWSEVQGSAIMLAPERFKGEEGKQIDERFIPLSPASQAILEALPRLSGPFVFSHDGERPFQNIGRLKRRLADAIDLEKTWRLHDLRKTSATGAQRLGVPQIVTEYWQGRVGEAQQGVKGIYQLHEYRDEVREAAEKWAVHLMGILDNAKIG